MATIGEQINELKEAGIYEDYLATIKGGNSITMAAFKAQVEKAKAEKKEDPKPEAKAKVEQPPKAETKPVAAKKKAPAKKKATAKKKK